MEKLSFPSRWKCLAMGNKAKDILKSDKRFLLKPSVLHNYQNYAIKGFKIQCVSIHAIPNYDFGWVCDCGKWVKDNDSDHIILGWRDYADNLY